MDGKTGKGDREIGGDRGTRKETQRKDTEAQIE
jgi:hypothetical protein